MAWTTPRTWTTGEVVTAALMNTHVRDNENFLFNGAGCRVTNSAAQTIANSTTTAVAWDTETFDDQAFHSTSSNTSRITVPTGYGGLYVLSAGLNWASNATGSRVLEFTKNGTALGIVKVNAPPTTTWYQRTVTVLRLVATDFVEVKVSQASGGNLNINDSAGDGNTEFAATYIAA